MGKTEPLKEGNRSCGKCYTWEGLGLWDIGCSPIERAVFSWFNAGCGCIRLSPKEETKRKPCLRVAQHRDVEANRST